MRITENNEIDLSEIRPHFKLISTLEVEDALDGVKNGIDNANEDEVRCELTHDHAHLKVPAQYEHYWSPVLSVGFEKNEDGNLPNGEAGGTLLRCLVGPSQAVWAMFMLVYGAIGMLVLFGMFYGGTKYQLENDSTYLWALPIALVMFIVVFFGAKIGQKKGHHQMDELIKFLFKCLDKGEIKNWD